MNGNDRFIARKLQCLKAKNYLGTLSKRATPLSDAVFFAGGADLLAADPNPSTRPVGAESSLKSARNCPTEGESSSEGGKER